MKDKKIIIIFACVLLGAFLLGVTDAARVANSVMGEERLEENDRLIGVFVTREPLDLFDFESYFNDNANEIMSGGEISAEDSAKYGGRLYAVLKDDRCVFEGVEGYSMFCATYTDESGTFTGNSGDEAISTSRLHVSHTDEGDGIELSGTLYVLPAATISYYPNPVYQSADGSVYTVSGSGMSVSDATGYNEGGAMTHTLTADEKTTSGGESTGWSADIELTVSVMYRPVGVAILHMGEDGVLLQMDEYAPGALPESVTPAEGTEYIITETFKTVPDGTKAVTRELFSPGDDCLTTFFPRADGVCVERSTAIDW